MLAVAACGSEPAQAPPDGAEPDAGELDAGVDGPSGQAITIPFVARVDGAAFACGQAYPDIVSTGATYVGIDFRFFVHGVRVVTPGPLVPVTLDVDSFQTADGIALMDFETGGVGCQMGSTATHTAITGTVPAGTEVLGVVFEVGVPFEHNHLDATLAVAPMNVPAMFWAWSSGYKFIKVDGTVNGNGFSLHVGSTGCAAQGTTPPSAPCASPNVMSVSFPAIDLATNVIVADVARLLTGVDLTTNTAGTPPGCMSDPNDPECDTVMPKLGFAFAGNPAEPQQFLAVE
jgi:uncharacterized repeat protein (TIGR04052 family)